jgi:hypothetical protein
MLVGSAESCVSVVPINAENALSTRENVRMPDGRRKLSEAEGPADRQQQRRAQARDLNTGAEALAALARLLARQAARTMFDALNQNACSAQQSEAVTEIRI